MSILLRGLTWSDPRGRDPLLTATEAFAHSDAGSGVRIEWDCQPLEGFESRALSELARRYDLLVIDHPHVGEAAESGLLAPVDLTAGDFIGRCAESYRWQNIYWAIPIDAACHVSAWREESFVAPCDWATVFDLPEKGVRIGAPLKGVHALMALYSLLASQGAELDPATGLPSARHLAAAATLLRTLAQVSVPESLNWNPIDALNALANGEIDYVPLTFGYSRYEELGVRFGSIPAWDGRTVSPILGGAGLAISANCAEPAAALDFAHFAGSRDIQSCFWARSNGQPAHRAAWEMLGKTRPFYRDTRASIESAFVRPRFAGWANLQARYGLIVERWLAGAASATHLESRLWQAAMASLPEKICGVASAAMDGQP